MDDFPGYHDPAGGDGGEDDAAADGDVFGEEVDLDFVLEEDIKSQSNVSWDVALSLFLESMCKGEAILTMSLA